MGVQHLLKARFNKAWAATKGSFAVVFGIATVGLIVLVAIQAIAIHRTYTVISWGSVSDAFAAVGTLLAVGVALWQSVVIRRQATEQLALQQDVDRKQQEAQLLTNVNTAMRALSASMDEFAHAAVRTTKVRRWTSRLGIIQPAILEGQRTQADLLLAIQQARLVLRDPQTRDALGQMQVCAENYQGVHNNLIYAVQTRDKPPVYSTDALWEIRTALHATMLEAIKNFNRSTSDRPT